MRTGNGLLFVANDLATGSEVWRTDGTTLGTTILKDINLASGGSSPRDFLEFQGNLWFFANDGDLWKSDGTASGTTMLGAVEGRHFIGGSTSQSLFFSATGTDDLWITDGTEQGTHAVVDMQGQPIGFTDIVEMNGVVYFQREDVYDREIWRSDGTPEGTYELFDVSSGETSSSGARRFTRVGDHVYFVAERHDPGTTYELWRTDGTFAGTQVVKNFGGASKSEPNFLTAFQGQLFFVSYDNANKPQLWKSDGTAGGTMVVSALPTIEELGGAAVVNFTASDDELFFVGKNAANGIELWASNGTPTGTRMVKDIRPGTANSTPLSMRAIGDTLYFTADNGEHGYELWTSDGTSDGTYMVQDIAANDSSFSGGFIGVDGDVYFIAYSNGIPRLWFTDGTSQGTKMVVGSPRSAFTYSAQPLAIGGVIYFSGSDDLKGAELWKFDTRAAALPGDLNDDGVVDIFDVAMVSNNWGGGGPEGDANYDGAVDIFDLAVVSNNWNPAGAADSAVTGAGDTGVAALLSDSGAAGTAQDSSGAAIASASTAPGDSSRFAVGGVARPGPSDSSMSQRAAAAPQWPARLPAAALAAVDVVLGEGLLWAGADRVGAQSSAAPLRHVYAALLDEPEAGRSGRAMSQQDSRTRLAPLRFARARLMKDSGGADHADEVDPGDVAQECLERCASRLLRDVAETLRDER